MAEAMHLSAIELHADIEFIDLFARGVEKQAIQDWNHKPIVRTPDPLACTFAHVVGELRSPGLEDKIDATMRDRFKGIFDETKRIEDDIAGGVRYKGAGMDDILERAKLQEEALLGMIEALKTTATRSRSTFLRVIAVDLEGRTSALRRALLAGDRTVGQVRAIWEEAGDGAAADILGLRGEPRGDHAEHHPEHSGNNPETQ